LDYGRSDGSSARVSQRLLNRVVQFSPDEKVAHSVLKPILEKKGYTRFEPAIDGKAPGKHRDTEKGHENHGRAVAVRYA
jgi:hypothetical protein